jgi:hypothetical protein
MKKITLLFVFLSVLCGNQLFSQCGQISIIGEFNGWAEDYFMSPDSSNPGVYHAHIHLSLSDDMDQNGSIGLKFREDSSWLVNWGGTGFPEGPLVQNGDPIAAAFGDFSVTFNCNAGYYIFRPTCGEISITSLGNELNDTLYMIQDSVNLNLWINSLTITEEDDPHGNGLVNVVFRESSEWMHYWGGNAFPQGPAIYYGFGIGVPYGTYYVTFNCETLEYDFKSTFGIGEAGLNDQRLTIFPNPANGTLKILIDKSLYACDYHIMIADLSGRLILEKFQSVKPGEDRINIDLNGIMPGIYLYRLEANPGLSGQVIITATGKLIMTR